MAGKFCVQTLTSSTITDYLTCPFKFYLSQIKGYSPKKRADYLYTGTLFHDAMEIRHKQGIGQALEHIKDSCRNAFEEAFEKDKNTFSEPFEKTEATVIGMLMNFPWWSQLDIVNAEREFIYPFNDFNICGKIDLTFRQNGKLYIGDYKTKGRFKDIGDPDVLRRNLQASMYYYFGCPKEKPDGFEFFYIKRPELRVKKNESHSTYLKRIKEDYQNRPEMYYQRHLTFRNPNGSDFIINLNNIIMQIENSFNGGFWVKNETACSIYSKCKYLPICNEVDGWQDWYESVGPDHHPELKIHRRCVYACDKD